MKRRFLRSLALALAFLPGACALAAGQAVSPEAAKAASEGAFVNALGTIRRFQPSLPAARSGARSAPEKVLQDPRPTPGDASSAGAEVGRVALPGLLDRHRDLMVRQLGALVWAIGPAGDPAFKSYFLTFVREASLVIAPLGDLERLRGEGINVRIDERTAYNFRVSINIFNPVRGSTLHITPTAQTSGPGHEVKTGVILDAVKAKSFVFRADSKEFWLLYGTDVDPKTNQPADTRSLLFIHEAGMDTKAWPLAESSLEVGRPSTMTLGDTRLALTRTAEGLLLINSVR